MANLRNLCIMGAVLMALPLPIIDQSVPMTQSSTALTEQIMSKATDTFSDMRNFCGQRPVICTSASDIAERIEARANYSLGLITDWANETAITTKATLADYQAFADTIMTGSLTPAPSAGVPALRGTILRDEGSY